jgi:hypothetical protein
MHYTQCCALALGSHYPEVLHRPTHGAIPASASALVACSIRLPGTPDRSSSAAGNVRAVGFPYRRASAKIFRACAQRLCMKRGWAFEALSCPT